MKKFYLGKVWRNAGYEEKTFMEVLKFSFSNIEHTETLVVSAYAQNSYFITLLMGTGFKFNKQTNDKGDPKQRLTLWMYRREFEKLMSSNLKDDIIHKKYYYKQ